MPAYRNTFSCDPQTKDDWRIVLDYLYRMYVLANLPVTVYPPMYCRGALRLDGLVKHSRIA